jgi:hypothetical protein
MARSRFGENQFVDVDVLSETEHSVLDHSGVPGTYTTVSGYTGNIEVLTSVSGSNYTKGIMYFEDGILTTFSGGIQV